MFQIIPPSQVIKCEDIVSCFQSLYNFFFMILLALAFLWFVYGVFQYLLSGATIFSKEEGKRKMMNSIVAVIVVLIIPPVLKLINPQIFTGITLKIPKVTILKTPELAYVGEDITTPGYTGEPPSPEFVKLNEYSWFKINVNSYVVHKSIVTNLQGLDQCLVNANSPTAIITSGVRAGPVICHSNGTCIDIVTTDNCGAWQTLASCLRSAGARRVIFEQQTGCQNPSQGCVICTTDCGVGWLICPMTIGYRHIHAEF